MAIEVFLVDDHRLLREGLRRILNQESGTTVVGEADDGRRAVTEVSTHRPDVVLMDVSMPGLNGIEATRRLATDCPEASVIALSMHGERRFVNQMLLAGASGYLLKTCSYKEVLEAVRAVAGGDVYLTPSVTDLVVEEYLTQLEGEKEERLPAPSLTPRTREVLQLISEGLSTRDIANELHISVKTVESHRKRIMDTLEIDNVAELTKYAIREGLTSL